MCLFPPYSGLSVENMMRFCTQALEHTAGEVREKAEKIIISLYKEVGAPVKDFLPPDDEKTRRNVLYKQLFEAFDRIDGKPSKEEQKVGAVVCGVGVVKEVIRL